MIGIIERKILSKVPNKMKTNPLLNKYFGLLCSDRLKPIHIIKTDGPNMTNEITVLQNELEAGPTISSRMKVSIVCTSGSPKALRPVINR
ncbi:MAG: hypothetical protein KBS59_06805 [Clostridiales bacterium]|nr:hypothetical protein [Clostridiales bacterium]